MSYRRLVPDNLALVMLLLLTVLPARATPVAAAGGGLALTWRDGARPAHPLSARPVSPGLGPAFHGPLAVLVGSGDRRPYSYSVTLVNIRAQVVASVRSSDTRVLRLGNNTGTPPLPPVSVSASHLFYIAGDT
ncbi:MAG TPA: hypothetical protein VNL71_03900, partial [Chloroflexota bacterium]|nr:hypothetical protein [Chloroflexota bacterium]